MIPNLKPAFRYSARGMNPHVTFLDEQLRDDRLDMNRLDRLGLPVLKAFDDLPPFFGLDDRHFREIADIWASIKPSDDTYCRFSICKANGRERPIHAPKKELRSIQDKIYRAILRGVEPHQCAHGFRLHHSTVTNALVHLNSAIVCHLDIKEFFPSIKSHHVHAVFKELGYPGAVASVLTRLCVLVPRRNDGSSLVVDPEREPLLPQGAPTSPALSNLVFRELDVAIDRISHEFGFFYSRYADDMVFSSTSRDAMPGQLEASIEAVISAHGFELNFKKKSIMRPHVRQRVTGIVVNNAEPSLPRPWVRNLRAALHQLADGRVASEDLAAKLREVEGSCHYAMMVNSKRYLGFLNEFEDLASRIQEGK